MQPIVVDTSVLIAVPDLVHTLKDREIFIPITVIEELDGLKKSRPPQSQVARLVIRSLELLRNHGSLEEGKGVYLAENNVKVSVVMGGSSPFHFLDVDNNDNRILDTTIKLSKEKQTPITLLTNDLNLRIKANCVGIEALPYLGEENNNWYLSDSVVEILVPSSVVNDLYNEGAIPNEWNLFPNQYVNLRSVENASQTGLGRFCSVKNTIMKVDACQRAWDIKPKNREQLCAMDALMSEVPVTILTGEAGSGKTFLSLAVAFERVISKNNGMKKIIIARPNIPIGNDIGFLPGCKKEKLLTWLEGVTDNAESLLGDKETFEMYVDKGIIELEAITYLRGRNLRDAFVLIDEAQNLQVPDVKTILSRVAEGTKIALMGDISQIDNRSVDERTNGLSYLVGKAQYTSLSTHVHLSDSSIRGRVASWAVKEL